METKIGIKQLSGIPGKEGNYIGMVSRYIQGSYVYSELFDITHIHYCSSSGWALNDCLKGFDGIIDNNFFSDKNWSGFVLEGIHVNSMDYLKNYFNFISQ